MAAERALRDFAMAFLDTHEDFPWGHRAIKVRGKAFVFMAREEGHFSLSAKLPQSSGAAVMLPFAAPTGYGLGKSGWVTASFARNEEPPVGLLQQWIEESYRAIAPARLVARLDSGDVGPSTKGKKAAGGKGRERLPAKRTRRRRGAK